jgi:hypothetical protein
MMQAAGLRCPCLVLYQNFAVTPTGVPHWQRQGLLQIDYTLCHSLSRHALAAFIETSAPRMLSH